MQHIIDDIKENLRNFIDEGAKTVLLIEAKAEESLLLLKTLSALEDDELSPDIFSSHTDSFTDARNYIDGLFENQKLQIESVNEALAERGEPLLEDFPAELANRSILNHDRLIGIASHVRRIVQPERKVIWVFFPLEEVEHEEAYAGLLRYLAFGVFDENIEGTKLIIRDTPAFAVKAKLLLQEEQVSFYRPGLDLDSIIEKIDKQCTNPQAPPDERAQSAMLMAGVDVAEKRFDEALRRNQEALEYFETSRQKQKQSVVHNNVGDIYYIQGDYAESQKHYEKAVDIAVDEEAQPLLIYQSMNLGNALFMQQKYDEALIYYDSSAKLAAINKALPQQIQALQRVGDTDKALGDTEKAVAIWIGAADICRENGYKIGLVETLERLDPAYDEIGEIDKRRENWRELEEARGEIREIEPELLKK